MSQHCVVPENIHIPTTEGIGNSRGVGEVKGLGNSRGDGGLAVKLFPDGQLRFQGTETHCTEIELTICSRRIKIILAILY